MTSNEISEVQTEPARTYIINENQEFVIAEENNNFKSLVNLMSPVNMKNEKTYRALKKVIKYLDFDFYTTLLPKIAAWASDHKNQSKLVEPLVAGKTARVVYSASQIRYLLSNAFFLNVSDGFGSIDLSDLYNHDCEISIARLRCLIEYFRLAAEENQENDQREISIERFQYKDEIPDWNQQNILVKSSKFNIFTDRMENSHEADGFVDFANKRIHIFRIAPSATQEEILFSCCPEAFVSILLCEKLEKDEIVILRGCKRYVDYTGYSYSFKFNGPFQNKNETHIQDILVMDACESSQFTGEVIDRDLAKAWAAFKKSNNRIIITGNWGCGAFGGDPYLKFLQQICAATILDEKLERIDYSVFGDKALAEDLQKILVKLEEKQQTVANIYQVIQKYRSKNSYLNKFTVKFRDYVREWVNSL